MTVVRCFCAPHGSKGAHAVWLEERRGDIHGDPVVGSVVCTECGGYVAVAAPIENPTQNAMRWWNKLQTCALNEYRDRAEESARRAMEERKKT